MGNCFACKKILKGLNTPLFNVSKTSDGKKACTTCHRKISVSLSKTNFNKYTSEYLLEESRIKIENKKRKSNKRKEVKVYKWYLRKRLLILLLFLMPPLGILLMFQRSSKLWKKLVYVVFGVYLSLVFFIIFIGSLNPVNYYKEGNVYFSQNKYHKAIELYKLVPKNEQSFILAQKRIEISMLKIDSIKRFEENKVNELFKQIKNDSISKSIVRAKRIEKLMIFQKQWADSILKKEKSYKSPFVENYKLTLGDSILLELSKNATKSFNSNINNTLPYYQSVYNKAIKSKSSELNNLLETKIYFIPNQKLLKKSKHEEWQRPVFINKGLKIYSGNRYFKEYIGTLNCRYENPQDGLKYFVLLQNNGEYIMIKDYEFQEYYWVKRSDSKKRMGIGLNKCYQF